MKRVLRWSLLIGFLSLLLFGSVLANPLYQTPLLFQQQLEEIRSDLEVLADRVFLGGTRPDGWTGNDDVASASAVIDLFIDNELLANAIYGDGLRPRAWIGATTPNGELLARNIRHDLEVAADTFIGEDLRPDEWIGGPALFRCSRTVMNTVYLLDIEFDVFPTTPETVRDFCPVLEDEIEDSLLDQALDDDELSDDAISDLLLAVRGDLERLADENLGVNNRPPGWLDNTDIESETFIVDLQTDLERLADITIGTGQRPSGWIGQTQQSRIATFRNLRFDLELLADITVGERPNGWQGDDPVFRCEPLLQSLVFLARTAYDYNAPMISLTGQDYCSVLSRDVNNFVEDPPPPPDEDEDSIPDDEEEEIIEQFSGESEFAFAYLDVAATQYLGVMPGGTQFQAIYRNFSPSTMMFVAGENFALYIDRRWTTLSQEVFNTLPTLEGVIPLTFCDARWCNGPGPTPTPTGSGALADIINVNTPPAPVDEEDLVADADTGEKIQVSWNAIRANYLLDRPETNTTQVTLEICRDSSGIVCEPVLTVFDTTTGQAVPSISRFNGLNVYELPYGYSTNYVIEGATYFSNELWLNDPTLTGQ